MTAALGSWRGTAFTRRTLLRHIGSVGGAGALAAAMQGLGLFGSGAGAALPQLPFDFGAGKTVIILGAGIAGLVAAYELERAGFHVVVLEARQRIGGRCWTIRDGDTIDMIGEKPQVARLSAGLYFNAGPARIPSFHQGMLGYAKKFGVALEAEINSSRSAYIAAPGSRIRMRAAVNDTRGYIAELLAKAINQGSLDAMISLEDRTRLLPFLKAFGDLNEHMIFTGTTRSGFGRSPGAGATSLAEPSKPVELGALLANPQLPMTLFDEQIYMQATMFEPVGGMDAIPVAIERRLRKPVIRGAEVRKIRQTPFQVEIAYRDTKTGADHSIGGDFAICTIPFPVLAKIETDLPTDYREAIASVEYDYSNKIAFDAPRFWEDDQIYGGISFVGGDTSLLWYPSAGLHSDRGTLLACYTSGTRARDGEAKSLDEQVAAARAAVEMVHPGHSRDCIHPLVVNWHKIPYSLGPWPAWNGVRPSPIPDAHIDRPEFRLLCTPSGRLAFAGAALSQTPGWQEGAVQSAHAAIAALTSFVPIAERSGQTASTAQNVRLASAG